jgi:hypothetical protein
MTTIQTREPSMVDVKYQDQCTDEALTAWCEENKTRIIETQDE